MFAFNHDSLVSQALSCGLVKDLLNILNSRLDNIPNASSCKAQVRLKQGLGKALARLGRDSFTF